MRSRIGRFKRINDFLSIFNIQVLKTMFFPDDIAEFGIDQIRGKKIDFSGSVRIKKLSSFIRIWLNNEPFDRDAAIYNNIFH